MNCHWPHLGFLVRRRDIYLARLSDLTTVNREPVIRGALLQGATAERGRGGPPRKMHLRLRLLFGPSGAGRANRFNLGSNEAVVMDRVQRGK